VTADTTQEQIFELMVKAVVQALKDAGVKQFSNLLPMHLLQALAARDEPDENKSKKAVLQKRVRESAAVLGVGQYLIASRLPKQLMMEMITLLSARKFVTTCWC
jgi:hypothetical protein